MPVTIKYLLSVLRLISTIIFFFKKKKVSSIFNHQKKINKKFRFNDNSQNEYSDVYYISNAILALGKSLHSTNAIYSGPIEEREKVPYIDIILEEVDRYLFREENLPSFHDVIRASCIEAMFHFQAIGSVPMKLQFFLDHSQPKYHKSVREVLFIN